MRKSVTSILLVLFITVSLSHNFSPVLAEETDILLSNPTTNQPIKELVSSGSIVIYSDADFESYAIPGSGTIDDPYRIENLLIELLNSYGIYISGVHKYFVIQNCHIRNLTYGGIIVQNTYSGYGNITNNVVENCNDDGIYVQRCEGITISDNTCTNNIDGINIKLSNNCTVRNNICEDNLAVGIHIELDSPNCLFENNTVNSNDNFGMFFYKSNGAFVYNNSLINNDFEVYEDTIEEYLKYEIEDNTINGTKMGYFKNSEKFTINDTDYNKLYIMNCSEVVVENLIIEGNFVGIFSYWSNNCTFQQNLFTGNIQIGLYIHNSNFTNIINNNFAFNLHGFGLVDSFHILIKGNNFTSDGIIFENINILAVPTITIENNLVNGLKLGYFYKEQSLTLSTPEYGQLIFYNCTDIIVSNQVLSQTQVAITVVLSRNFVISNCITSESAAGIIMNSCYNVTILDCSINENSLGLSAYDLSLFTVENTEINSNRDSGFELLASNNVIINHCTVNNNEFGLFCINNFDVRVNGSLIANNTQINLYAHEMDYFYIYYTDLYFSTYGIYLQLTEVCFIKYCNIKNADVDGIHLRDSIRVNVLWSNSSLNLFGIRSRGSTFCKFLYNTFAGNAEYGISLNLASEHNLIHHNVFNENKANDVTGRLSQCFDDGYNNTWYDIVTYEGNRWSNIDSYYYQISGYAYSVDIFPLNPVEVTYPTEPSDESSFYLLVPLVSLVPIIAIYTIKRKKRNIQ